MEDEELKVVEVEASHSGINSFSSFFTFHFQKSVGDVQLETFKPKATGGTK